MVKLWGRGVVVRGCGRKGVWPGQLREVGTNNLKIHQNGRNSKCSSLGCVVRSWGEGCCREGVWPQGKGESKMLNDMFYIKMAKIKNVVQYGV